MRKYLQGKYIPKNVGKYVGNPTEIMARSSWERKVMIFLDMNPDVISWTSETVVVPYYSKTDQRYRRYFVDFAAVFRQKSGGIKKVLIEVKPKAQTLPPKKPAKMTKRYLEEVSTYITNQCKWEAATAFCKQHGYDEFVILTEDQIYKK